MSDAEVIMRYDDEFVLASELSGSVRLYGYIWLGDLSSASQLLTLRSRLALGPRIGLLISLLAAHLSAYSIRFWVFLLYWASRIIHLLANALATTTLGDLGDSC